MRLASTLGGKMARVLVVANHRNDGRAGYGNSPTAAVESAIEPAVALLESLVV